MNKLAPLFAATMVALSGIALAQDDAGSAPSDPAAQPDAPQQPGDAGQQGQDAQPKGFVLIQRNIYVPIDEQGNVASQKWIVIDKQGFITAEEMEKAANEASAEGDAQGGTEGKGDADVPKADEPAAQPSSSVPLLQKRPSIGEGPMVRS